jgi:hypothetical protein
MKRSQKADPKNLSQTIAKPFARKKYDFTEEGDPKAGPELSAGLPKEETVPLLSDRDQRTLARMVRDYGLAAIIAAAKAAPPPQRRGRPLRPMSYYERWHETEWIEEVMEENRQRGSRSPLLEALLLLHEYKGNEKTQRDIQTFLSTSKRRFKLGRQELRELQKRMQRLEKKKALEK